MVWMRHRGCSTPLVEYVGAVPLMSNPRMRWIDWREAGGKFAPLRLDCPDCGQRIGIHADQLETCDGSPHRYQYKPEEPTKKQTLFERLLALFAF